MCEGGSWQVTSVANEVQVWGPAWGRASSQAWGQASEQACDQALEQGCDQAWEQAWERA